MLSFAICTEALLFELNRGIVFGSTLPLCQHKPIFVLSLRETATARKCFDTELSREKEGRVVWQGKEKSTDECRSPCSELQTLCGPVGPSQTTKELNLPFFFSLLTPVIHCRMMFFVEYTLRHNLCDMCTCMKGSHKPFPFWIKEQFLRRDDNATINTTRARTHLFCHLFWNF